MAMELPDFERLIDAPRHYARHTPAATATWFAGATLSYGELDAAIDGNHGLPPPGSEAGDRGRCSAPPARSSVVMLGAQRAAVYVGLNPAYTRRELLHVLHDSEPSVVCSLAGFGGRDFAHELAELLAEVPSVRACYRLDAGPAAGPLRAWRELTFVDTAAALPQPGPSDAAALVYTLAPPAPEGALLPTSLAYGALVDGAG
jgi:acyl-CoA synthetase (AMP-forming)/AMP-acid ligase II